MNECAFTTKNVAERKGATGSDVEFADSPWSELPPDWEFTRLKWLVQSHRPITYGIVQCGPDQNEGVPYIRPVDMKEEGGLAAESLQKTTEDIAAQYQRSSLESGDLVVSIGPSFGKVMEVPPRLEGANLTQGTALVAPGERIDKRFLFWVLRCNAIHSFWEANISGATFRALTLKLLRRTPVPLPPLPIQSAITAFLDNRTKKIDRLIAKKKRLIELLEEKGTALITRAVTKGLDPDVPMKKSGVDWLGQVPSHWDLAPLKATIRDWKGGKWGHDPDGNDELVCLRVEDFDRFEGVINMNDPTVRSLEPRYREGRRLENGDLLLEKSGGGDKQPVGFAVLVKGLEEEAICSNFVARLSVRDEMSSSFLRYLLYHLYHTRVNTRSIKQTTGIQNLDVSHYLSTRVAVPPPSEQEAIAGRLEDQTHQIQEVVSKIESAVSRLKEYRTSMITAAVTGKIDVRDYAA